MRLKGLTENNFELLKGGYYWPSFTFVLYSFITSSINVNEAVKLKKRAIFTNDTLYVKQNSKKVSHI